jgi:hypothetical protein
MNLKNLTWGTFWIYSSIVFIVWGCMFLIIHCCIAPIHNIEMHKDQVEALTFLSALLGLLAGGCIAGFFSFEYFYAEKSELCIVQTIAYILIGGIFILVFLSLYCLAKVGIFKVLDWWAIYLLFLGTYAVLNSIVLLDRWDATKRPRNEK